MAFLKSFEIPSLKPKNWPNSPVNQLLRPCLAELVGTAILVIFTCGACTSTSDRSDTLVATALSFGLTVTCLVASLGHISGCHVNPSVTIGLLMDGQISLVKSACYIVAQMLGSVIGAGILNEVLVRKGNLCSTTLSVSPGQGVLIEAFLAFLLVFVVCNVCESQPANAPLLIGLAVTAGHLFAIPLTSSSMNSARSFGPTVISGMWTHHWVYWIGPILGGMTGGLFHRFICMNKTISDSSEIEDNDKNISTLSKITSI